MYLRFYFVEGFPYQLKSELLLPLIYQIELQFLMIYAVFTCIRQWLIVAEIMTNKQHMTWIS